MYKRIIVLCIIININNIKDRSFGIMNKISGKVKSTKNKRIRNLVY